ncbi:homoserine O-acetyltransferase [Allomyces macrogynus ATCC 38327]|uniref:Homoserine O-acetyltransferase n=1 Tax=Allomyces macrogynus (strain ATCC 38327) TaxID=578462 RepID=A0A0L0SPM0_ALLM3|nr:homoserine O-acetyltransferase [Allomyces macrogynus ATCC 38327]|eukprot:KNE64432.1 homoserine O-acetyltransferase [Allomyces macrogynus ATCC 38327]
MITTATAARQAIVRQAGALPRSLAAMARSCTVVPTTCRAYSASACSPKPASRSAADSASVAAAPLEFPCLDKLDRKTSKLQEIIRSSRAPSGSTGALDGTDAARDPNEGPEPHYSTKQLKGYQLFHHTGRDFYLDNGGVLPQFQLAYETWGTLNAAKTNAILLHTGLSASSHAKSHAENPDLGWWEDYIGPGLPLDTNKYFIICTNCLGGCYGSTGPSSIDPATGEPYAARFPFVTLWDMLRAQKLLLESLGIETLHASVGASMGGMQSLALAAMYPQMVQRLVTISSCARAHPYSIALRFVQRQVLMADPAYASTRGNYYGGLPPHVGMKLAREIATITYRSGPEWEKRFGRRRVTGEASLCPDFQIENYLDHQGEKFSLQYDANSLLWLSKAMDMFDMAATSMDEVAWRKRLPFTPPSSDPLPDPTEPLSDDEQLALGLSEVQMPTLVLGVTSDILFPLAQQQEIARVLRLAGNKQVTSYVLDGDYGHDTFLLDKVNVGAAVAGHLA